MLKKKSINLIKIAQTLNDIKDVEKIGDYYVSISQSFEKEIYNTIVFTLGMCINKELTILLKQEEVSVEDYPNLLKEIYKNIFNKYIKNNEYVVSKIKDRKMEDYVIFNDYLDNMVKVLLSGIQYQEKKDFSKWTHADETNEWNTLYRREERIRDKMKKLISKGEKYYQFTIEHNIELPYMYTLAWDLPHLLQYYGKDISLSKNSYLGNLQKNVSCYLNSISKNTLEILLDGMQFVENKNKNTSNPSIRISHNVVSYEDLLPTIEICEKVDYYHIYQTQGEWNEEKHKFYLPLIKKEILQKKPLVPMNVENRYDMKKEIQMVVELLEEKNENKDYLEWDLIYFQNNVVNICITILKWLMVKHNIILRKKETENKEKVKEKAERYLKSIINAVNNIPRKNNEENKKDYLEKIGTVIVKEWDNTRLKNIVVEAGNYKSYVEYAYFSVLKLSRNWNAHKLIKEYSISFIVFLFLISIRNLLVIDELDIVENRDYMLMESKLFKFFTSKKISYKEVPDIENILNQEYVQMYNFVLKNAFEREDISPMWARDFPCKQEIKDPHHVLSTAGFTRSRIKNQMSENEIFLTFWLTLHFGSKNVQKFNNKVKEIDDLNIKELLEYTFDYQKKSVLLKYE